jgi:hypothetical protein
LVATICLEGNANFPVFLTLRPIFLFLAGRDGAIEPKKFETGCTGFRGVNQVKNVPTQVILRAISPPSSSCLTSVVPMLPVLF